jgi:hypothetical protein
MIKLQGSLGTPSIMVDELYGFYTPLTNFEAWPMTARRYIIVILLVMMVSACSNANQGQSAKSLPDNPENRTITAKR